jgi:hypothetical protein
MKFFVRKVTRTEVYAEIADNDLLGTSAINFGTQKVLIMSISGISAVLPVASHSAPAGRSPSVKSVPTSAPATTSPAGAPSASQSAASAATAAVSASAAALREATETSAQTAKEAAGGDRAAQRILAKQSAAAVAVRSGTSATQAAVSARGSIISKRA